MLADTGTQDVRGEVIFRLGLPEKEHPSVQRLSWDGAALGVKQ